MLQGVGKLLIFGVVFAGSGRAAAAPADRARAAAELNFRTSSLELGLALKTVGANHFVISGAEVLDHDGVAEALKTFCNAHALDACEAFDGDGDWLADAIGQGEGEGVNLAKAAREATLEAARAGGLSVRLVASQQGLSLVGLGLIGDATDQLGFVRLTRRLGTSFLEALVAQADVTLGLAWNGHLLLASDQARGALQAALGKSLGQPLALQSLVLEPDHLTLVALGEAASASDRGALATWQALSGAATALILLVLAATVFLMRRERKPFQTFARSLTERLTEDGEAPRLTPTGGAVARRLAEVINATVDKQREALAKAQGGAIDIERKLGRVADLLTIDDGAFRLFRAKVERLHSLSVKEAQSLKAGVTGDEAWDALAQILRHVHTIKSNARLFNLNRVHHAAKDYEDFLADALGRDHLDESLIEQLKTQLDYITHEVATYHELRTRLLGDVGRNEQVGQQQALRLTWLTSLIGRIFTNLKNPAAGPVALGSLYSEYQDAVASVGKADLVEYVARYDRMLREMAARGGKQLAPLALTGNLRFVSHDVMELLNDVFLHCIRNSLDHGIEAPLKRQAFGKSQVGLIQIDCNSIGGLAAIVIRDDGRGIDPGELRARAVESGFYSAADVRRLGDEEVLNLVFETGFSTAAVVTEISGRGVGMDVVRETLRQLGGDVSIRSLKGHGTEVHLHFPLVASRFQSRLSLFNIHAEVRTIIAALAPHLKQTDVYLEVAAGMKSRALVLLDRILFTEAVKELLLELNTYAPKPCRLNVQLGHAASGEACSLETFALVVTVEDAQGRRLPAVLEQLGIEQGGRLADLMLDCGLYLATSPAQGRVEIQVPAGISDVLPDVGFQVLALVEGQDNVGTLVREQCHEHFGELSSTVYGRDRLDEFLSRGAGNTIVILDDKALADHELLRCLVQAEPANVVLVVPEMATVPLRSAFYLSQDPLIIEGVLDAAAVAQALEFSLQRHVMRLKASRHEPAELRLSA